jgi:hypothetical protein
MKTITETFDVFTYDELCKTAQDAVVNQIIQDWIECPDCIPDFEEVASQYDKACQKSEEMRTPWFLGEYIWEYCHDFVISEAKQSYYLASGKWYCPIDE